MNFAYFGVKTLRCSLDVPSMYTSLCYAVFPRNTLKYIGLA
jgi:hypothetical protein